MHEPDPTRDAAAAPSPTVAERLVVDAALAQQSARAAVARPPMAATPRRDGHGGRSRMMVRQRRGVVLVFVVVLLTLLGIMGTAYLASSRLDRQSIIGRGSLTGTQTALLRDPRKIDEVQAGVERAVKIKIIRDLFNIAPGYKYDTTTTNSGAFALQAYAAFRQPFQYITDPDVTTTMVPSRWFHDMDAPGRSDPYLSSLLAIHPSATAGDYRWRFIGAPLGEFGVPDQMFIDPYFADPRYWSASNSAAVPAQRYATQHHTNIYFEGWNPTAAAPAPDDRAVLERQNAVITSQTLVRPATAANPAWDNTRTYPALQPVIGGAVANAPFIAGDADGDGIADGGLMPVEINLTNLVNDPATNTVDPPRNATLSRYLDTANNVIYYASYRVVDNNAKLNLNTALDKRGELVNLNVATSTTENSDTTDYSELRNFLGDNLSIGTAGGIPQDFTGRPGPAADGSYGPNYGFFRSNIGLTDLIRNLISPINQAADPNDVNSPSVDRYPAQSELRRFIDARFPLLKQNPGTGYVGNAATDAKDIQRMAVAFGNSAVVQFRYGTFFQTQDPTPNSTVLYGAMTPNQFYQFRSFGDLLEQQVARRPLSPGGYLWSNNTVASALSNGLVSLGAGDAASLAAKGGTLANDLLSPGTAETALMFSLRMSTPNVNNNGDAPWAWFPPNAVDLWYGWTQDFNAANGWAIGNPIPPSITAIEDATIDNRAYSYNATNAAPAASPLANPPAYTFGLPGKPPQTADVVLPRSPRALFTTYNGVTNTAPERGDVTVTVTAPAYFTGPGAYTGPTPGVPIGMPSYSPATVRRGALAIANSAVGVDPAVAGVTFSYPAQKVSAATGTKEQLWRAFWSAMTQQYFFRYRNTAGNVAYSSYWDVKEPLIYPVPLTGADDPEQTYNSFRSSDRWESIESQTIAGRNYLPSSNASTATGSQLGASPSINTPYERSVKPEQTLSTRQMALIRSAVAACNTIDLRDNDNDITAMDVDLTDDNDVLAGATTPRYYARVYGTEKQLVISGVFLQSTGAGYAAIEIYNPTDVPIRLSAYRLAVVNRTRAAIGTPNPLLDGSIERTNPTGVAGPTNTTIALSTDVGQTLAPGGYVVVSSAAAAPAGFTLPAESTHAPAPVGTPEVYVITPATPNQANAANFVTALATNAVRSSELMLCRTRRADGEAFTDQTAVNATTAGNGVRQKIENEVLDPNRLNDETGTDVTTLVPVDGVDCRFLIGGTGRYSYTRVRPTLDATLPSPVGPYGAATTPLTGPGTGERAGAWRCFYAGQFYPLREANGTARNPATPVASWSADTNDNYAWQELSGGTAVSMADPTLTYDWTGARGPAAQGGLRAPAIPIQNFAPYDPFSETNRRTVLAPAATPGVPDDTVRVYGNSPTNNSYNAMITGTPTTRGLFHLINEFPYGSPVARDMDLMAIPYIGTYKIYRTIGTGLADTVLYDYVPLPMDAVAVAPRASDVYDPVTPATQIKTVGRFDPRLNLDTAAYTVPISQLLNNWAADLTNYVTARRQQRRTFFPDVPSISPSTTFITSGVAGDPNPQNTAAYLAKDQRYAQDGPVLGTSNTFNLVNDFNDTGFVSFTERSGSDATLLGVNRTGLRAGYEYTNVNADASLVQGVINVNTAPQVVLRELPWYVSPVTGQTDFTLGDANSTTLMNQTKSIVGFVEAKRDDQAAMPSLPTGPFFTPVVPFNPKTAATVRTTFGFDSLQRLAEDEAITAPPGTLKTAPTVVAANAPTAEELMRIGVLNPINRMEGQANYEYSNANLNRLSNLTSTRSDVFTVYVTVQAWTWAPGLGGNQQTDTRLIGERRSSFIVDRSKINGSNFDVSNLITLPIERE